MSAGAGPGSEAPGAARLGLGCAALGNLYTAVDDDTARRTVDRAWEAGVRLFDTAPHYGLGLSERRLGVALAGRPRGEFQVSTKVGRLLVPNTSPGGRDTEGFDVPDDLVRRRDYRRDGVRRSLTGSLERLGLDHVDLGLVHDPEDHLDDALDHALPALAELREEGLVGRVGVGMNLVEPLRRFVATGAVDVVMVAGRWTLLDRSAEVLLAECHEAGVEVLAAGPFNSGLLAREVPADDATFDYGPAGPEVLARARALTATCAAHGVALPAAALHFPLRHPAVTHVVAGVRSPEEVDAAVTRLTAPVPEELWPELGA